MSQSLPENTKTGDFNPQRTLSGSFSVIPERLASIRAVVLTFSVNKLTNTLTYIYRARYSTTRASCRGWYHHVCKWTSCTSGWMKKQHQCKLQLVTTTTCASGMFRQLKQGKTTQVQGAKVRTQGAQVRASISASRIQQQHATTTTTTTDNANMTNTAWCSNQCNLREA